MKRNLKLLLIKLIVVCGCLACSKSDEEVCKSSRQLYSFEPSEIGFSCSPPTIVNDNIFIGSSANLTYLPSSQNYFYKLDRKLNCIWKYNLGKQQLRGAASLDSEANIYFIVDKNRTEAHGNASIELYSLDKTGNYRWSKIIDEYDSMPGMRSIAIAEDNTIYVGGDSFYAFNPDGSLKWKFEDDRAKHSNTAPIIDLNGNIYFAVNGTVFSLNEEGKSRWIYETKSGECNLSSLAFNTDYSNIIFAESKTIYSIGTENGNLNWNYLVDMNADFRATPALDDKNNIYIGSHGYGNEKDESTLYALKADGSGLLWKYHLGSDMYSSPTLGKNRILYIGSEGHGFTNDKHNRLHAFNMDTGERVWSAQLKKDILWGSPILGNDGILYVTTMYYNNSTSGIYAFKTNSYGLLPNSASATFQGSNSHTGRRE